MLNVSKVTAEDIWFMCKACKKKHEIITNKYVNKINFKSLIYLKHGNDSAYILLTDNYNFLFVNSTDDIVDFFENLLWFIRGEDKSPIGYNKPGKFFSEEVRDVCPKDKKLIISGTSRGSAIAASVINYLKNDYDIKGILYAGPKEGNESLKESLDEIDIDNYIVKEDIIPKLPLLRGLHVGKIKTIFSNINKFRKLKIHFDYWNGEMEDGRSLSQIIYFEE